MNSIDYALNVILCCFVISNQLVILFLCWSRRSETQELKKIRENQEKLLAVMSLAVQPFEKRCQPNDPDFNGQKNFQNKDDR